MGTFLGILWLLIGLVGSFVFSEKGYSQSAATFLWGAMLGPIQFLLAVLAQRRV